MYLLLADGDGGALGGASDEAPAPDTSNEGGESAPESTTPEEVAETLRNAGINLPPEPTPAAADEAEEGDDPDAPTAGAEGEGQDTEEVANEDPIEPETKPEPAPAEEAPTDAKEYSFEVEDANGVTFKITADDKMETVLAEFQPKNNGQIIDILDQLRGLKEEQRIDAVEAERAAEEANSTKAVEDIRAGWQKEFKQLDITDDARQGEVMKFMGEENDKRQEAGRPLIRTVEHALLGLEKQEAAAAAEEKAKTAKEEARKNGSLVGGSSAPATPASAVYKAGSARNSNEAIKAMGLL